MEQPFFAEPLAAIDKTYNEPAFFPISQFPQIR